MIRERRLAEKQQRAMAARTPSSSGGSCPTDTTPSWHRDLQLVAQTIRAPYFDEETILTRSRLIRAVKTAPHDVNAWRQLITKMDEDRKASSAASATGCGGGTGGPESADFDMHNNMVRLLETSTRVIPRSSANRYSWVYVSIWLDLARVHQELPVDSYLARDVYKTLRSDRIGTTFEAFWNSYADFEERQGEIEKAKRLRAEIPKRCHIAAKQSTVSTTPAGTGTGSKIATTDSNGKNDNKGKTGGGALGGLANKDKEKENRIPSHNHAVRGSGGRSTPSQIPSARRNVPCTPPSQVLPDPKRMHVESPDSPESLRRQDTNRSIEEPNLVSNIPSSTIANSNAVPSGQPELASHLSSSALPDAQHHQHNYNHVHPTPQSLQQPRNFSHATSWKLRAQQPLHSASSTPNSFASTRTGGVNANTNANPAMSYSHRGNTDNDSNIPNTDTRLRSMRHAAAAAPQLTPAHSNPLPLADAHSSRSATRRVPPDSTPLDRVMDSDRERRYRRHTPNNNISSSNNLASRPYHAPVTSMSNSDDSSSPSPHMQQQRQQPQHHSARRGGQEHSDSSYRPAVSKELERQRQQYDGHGEHPYDNRHHHHQNEVVGPCFLNGISQNDIIEVNGKQYLQLGVIGKGGSSKVFKVLNHKLVVMALKRVHVRKSSANFKATFDSYANEINLLKSLRGKPHIVYCHDAEVREDQGIIHLVMEHGDIDLAKQLVQSQNNHNALLDENFRRVYWTQMLQAVRTIHEAKIVHGDLKPANFLIVAGTLKLIDFGIAKAIQTEDTTKIIRDVQVGTPNYMSPEALTNCDDIDDDEDTNDYDPDSGGGGGNRNHNGRPKYRVGRASDIWSLGCILYQMVYGKTPFAHINHMVIKLRCIQDESFAIQYPPVQDQDVLTVLHGCLQRDPNNRLSIPALLSHPFLRRRPMNSGSGDGKNIQSAAAAVAELPQHVWEGAVDQCLGRVIGKNVVNGTDKWNAIVRSVAKSLPQELVTKHLHTLHNDISQHHDQDGSQDGSGGVSIKESSSNNSSGLAGGGRTGDGVSRKRGVMMTPTTSGVTTNQGTKTNGYTSGHSYV